MASVIENERHGTRDVMSWDVMWCRYSRFRATSVRPPQRVLLTGASGFLGAHILVSLLRDTHVDVFCLVRAGNEEEALVRLEDTLHK